jgi:hypothetical protein
MQTPSPSLIVACHYDLLLLNSQGDSFESRVLDFKHRRIKAVVVLRKGRLIVQYSCLVSRGGLSWQGSRVMGPLTKCIMVRPSVLLGSNRGIVRCLMRHPLKELQRDRFKLFFSFLNVLILHDNIGRVLRTFVWQHWVSHGGNRYIKQ